LEGRKRVNNRQLLGADCIWVDAPIVAALDERGDAVNDRVYKADSTELQSVLGADFDFAPRIL